MIIRRSTHEDIPFLQKLWQEVFGDPPAFTERFYENFGADCALIAVTEGKIVAMIHTLPVAMAQAGQYRWGTYLYALATSPTHRGQGIASELLTVAERAPFATLPLLSGANESGLQEISDLIPSFSILIPGEESLFNYYRRKGYTRKARVISAEAPDYPSHLREGLGSTPILLKPEPFYSFSSKIPECVPPPVETALWKAHSSHISPEITPTLSHFMQ